MDLWLQIAISGGTVLALLGGFYGISENLKKDINAKTQALEDKFTDKLEAQRITAKAEKAEEATEQKELCKTQCAITAEVKEELTEYREKQRRIAVMQFKCNFTTLEALNKIAHNEPINGEIKNQLKDLKDFTIQESLQQ